MTLDEFNKSVSKEGAPPKDLDPALQALWWDAKGDWDQAHQIVQDDPSPNSSWVHAFLHRKGGDETNAAYWYAKAVRPVAHGPFGPERDRIAAILLEDEIASS